jgi:hypothetical protein
MGVTSFLIKITLTLVGVGLGGLIGFWGLFVVSWMLAQVVEDQTSLGWLWVLALITTPLGAIVGGVYGFRLHRGSTNQKNT